MTTVGGGQKQFSSSTMKRALLQRYKFLLGNILVKYNEQFIIFTTHLILILLIMGEF